jgi:PAT family beta-lactamase induction signal transducer AmpG
VPGRLIASQSGRIVEGAARSAEVGGVFAPLKGLFASTTPGALAQGAAKAGVSPAALGAGYLVFFLYSCVIGVAAVVLTLMVVARSRRR